jgi:O-acetyl-ADP-ribose deacetylase (regulator of RNase III)
VAVDAMANAANSSLAGGGGHAGDVTLAQKDLAARSAQPFHISITIVL